MRILITGATGLLGQKFARASYEAGDELVVVSRDAAGAAARVGVPCRALAWEGLASPAALAGIDSVVHLAGDSIGEGRWTPAKRARILASRVDGLRTLARAIAALSEGARPATVISASAVGIFGDRGDALLNESADPGQGFLADVCRAWEAEAHAIASLVPRVASLRFGVILDRDGGMLGKLAPLFRAGLGGRVGDGRQWVSWIHVADAVGALRFVLGGALRGPVNGVAPAPARQGDFARELGRALGRPAWVPAPAFAVKLALGDQAALVLQSQRVDPQALREAGYRFRFPELAGALADLFPA